MKLRAPAPIVIAVLILLAVAAAWAVGVVPALGRLQSAIASAVESRAAVLLDGLDMTVSYDSASPRLLGSVSVGGVELRSGGETVARAESVSLRYDVSSALAGKFEVSLIRVEGLVIDTDYGRAVSALDRIVGRFAPAGGSAGTGRGAGTGPAIEVRRSTIRLSFDQGASADAAVRAADIIIGRGGLVSASAAGTLRGRDPARRFFAERAELPFSCTFSFQPGAREASLVAIVAGDSDIGRLSPVTARLAADPAGVTLSVDPGGGLNRLEAAWDASLKRLSVDAAMSGWKPAALFAPAGKLAFLKPWLEAPYTGSLSLSTDLSAQGSSASVNLSGIIPVSMPGGRPRATLAASGSLRKLTVRLATLRNDVMDVSFAGDLSPASLGAAGRLSVRYTAKPGLDAAAEFDVSGAGSSWFAYTPMISVADAELRDGTVSVELTESSVQFYVEAALPYVAANQAATDILRSLEPFEAASAPVSSRVVVEGSASLGSSPYVEAALRLGVTDFAAFPELLSASLGPAAARALAPLSVEGEFSIYSDFTGLSYNSSSLLLVYDGPVNGFGVASFSGGLGRLDVTSIEATIAGFDVTGSASVDYGSGPGLGFEAAIRVADIPYAVAGTVMDGTVVLTGDYGLRVLARDDGGTISGRLGIDDMPVPLLGTVSFLSASANARFASMEDWDLVFDTLSLTQPPGTARPLPSVSASGAFDESGGSLGRLAFSDKVSALKGSANVTWTLGDGFRVSANVRMAGNEGEYYVVDGEYRGDGGVDAAVSMRKAPLARLNVPAIKGVIDADATVAGSVDDPRVGFGFTVNGGQRADGLPFAAGTGTYGGKIVTLADTRLRLGSQSVSGLSLRYDVEDAGAELSADIELSLGTNDFSGRLVASGLSAVASSLMADGKDGEAVSPFDDYVASGAIRDARWTEGDIGTVPVRFTMKRGAMSLTAGGDDELRAKFGASGELSFFLADSLPLSLTAEGRYSGDILSLDVAEAVVDLPFLFKLIGLNIIRVESGVGRGNLRIRGKLNDPSVEGVVDFENFYLSVPDFVSAPIGPLKDPLYFTGRAMETSQSDVACGDALVIASLESTLHGGIPNDIRLSVQTSGEGLVPISTLLLGMEISGLAKPDLIIEANPDRSRIRGAIALQSGDIVLTPGIIRKKSSSSSDFDFAGALDLSFGKNVKVYFPDRRLPVIYGQADPSSKLAVAFDASRGEYSVKGATMLRGGSVFYIQRNFYLKQAVIEFDEDEDQFDPRISAEAETRTSTDSGPVLVTLRAVDSRLTNLKFTLESVPSMSEADIQQLLGQNLFGGTSDGTFDIGRAVVENIDLIPQLNVASVLERNLQALLGIDLFVVRSLVFQRWLYDLSGLSGSTRSLTIADYLDDTAIVGGKYIGDKLFFQVMLTLVSDPLASTMPLSLDSDISIEWKAPHFTLNWSVQPKNLDTLFIEDQSFSFLWRIPLQ